MNEAMRYLILRVLDDHHNNIGACSWVKEIYDSYVESGPIFKWLIRNDYTGANFVALISEHNFNTFEACLTILNELHKEKGRGIYLGRDFKPH